MGTRVMGFIIAILLLVIAVFAWMFFVPNTAHAPTVTEITTPAVSDKPTTTKQSDVIPPPLHERIVVNTPKSNSTVGKSFEISGEAPGNWFFEASFPIQVRDKDDNVVGRAHGNAQGEWMTEQQVKFIATVNIDGPYTGPATLILLRDNPSGLPENDDSFEVPIVIK